MTTPFPTTFLWGGATAAKTSSREPITKMARACPSRMCSPTAESVNHAPTCLPDNLKLVGIDHYHRYAEDVKLFAEMGFAVSTASRSPGRGSSRMGTKKSQMKRASPSTTVSWTNSRSMTLSPWSPSLTTRPRCTLRRSTTVGLMRS